MRNNYAKYFEKVKNYEKTAEKMNKNYYELLKRLYKEKLVNRNLENNVKRQLLTKMYKAYAILYDYFWPMIKQYYQYSSRWLE